MKTRSLFYIIVLLFFFSSCEKEEETQLFTETGTVKDLNGSGNCGFVIELENGTLIHPLYYPKTFNFIEGQRVFVEYTELANVVSTCSKGINCEILSIEELSCTPVIGLTSLIKDTFRNDAVSIQEIKVNNNCISILLSFSGGCREHKINLVCLKPVTNATEIPVIEIRHNANGDMCEAWLTRDYGFDLRTLKSLGIKEVTIRAKNGNGSYFEKKIAIL